jgi:hypothetical protein
MTDDKKNPATGPALNHPNDGRAGRFLARRERK